MKTGNSYLFWADDSKEHDSYHLRFGTVSKVERKVENLHEKGEGYRYDCQLLTWGYCR